VLARVLHDASPRRNGPFVALNCAALPEHLIEDLLFGHEKGAFTGALKEHRGLFEQAHGGTIFLDEIAEMPYHLQTKLLRVLQERKITRLGGHGSVELDVRLVAATNKDLREAINNREFREDLYFRISAFKLTILPLRERPGDVLPLAMQFLEKFGPGDRKVQLSPTAIERLQGYSWPGNVRELQNVIQRALVLCNDDLITDDALMFDEIDQRPTSQPLAASTQSNLMQYGPREVSDAHQLNGNALVDLSTAVKSSEYQVIMAAIQSTRNRNEAAKKLGISPRSLRYKMAQFRELGMAANPANQNSGGINSINGINSLNGLNGLNGLHGMPGMAAA
jgi:two-component system response regulator FlrC